MTIVRNNDQGMRESVHEIKQERFFQLMKAAEYVQKKGGFEVVEEVSDNKWVLTLKDQKAKLLVLEAHRTRDNTRYFYSEAA